MTEGEQGARSGGGRTTWADVERRAAGEPIPRPVARRSKEFRIALAFAAVGLAVTAGMIGWLLVGDAPDDRTVDPVGSDGPAFIVGAVLLALAVVVWVVGTIVIVRTGGFSFVWQEPTVGLPRRERRAIEREVRGTNEPAGSRVPTLRHLAALRLRQSRFTLVLCGGWLLWGVGQSLNPAFPWGTWFWLAFVVLNGVGLVMTLRVRGQWRAFLTAHPDGVAPSAVDGEPAPER